MPNVQPYPRIEDENDNYFGYLDIAKLKQHSKNITKEELLTFVKSSIRRANEKSSREILNIPTNATEEEKKAYYKRAGRDLVKYFKNYCGDPAATAHQVYNRNYKEVGIELFKTKTLQRQRMNSGWRYQFFVIDCAQNAERFISVSDLGTAEADFNATIEYIDNPKKHLNLYVSVKNRSNTLGGQDWPQAIRALESYAIGDKNRVGPYLCVFGIAMEKGERLVKRKRGGEPHSHNTEVWKSDFFWPFFTNQSYESIMKIFLEVLMEEVVPDEMHTEVLVPQEVIEEFKNVCIRKRLINPDGIFHDPEKLVEFFCN